MIGLLRAILSALEVIRREALEGQQDAVLRHAELAASIEHLRVLVEGDAIPTAVGAPTFTGEPQ